MTKLRDVILVVRSHRYLANVSAALFQIENNRFTTESCSFRTSQSVLSEMIAEDFVKKAT